MRVIVAFFVYVALAAAEPLRVLGAGYGRTGTTSLGQALELLGFGRTLVFSSPMSEVA